MLSIHKKPHGEDKGLQEGVAPGKALSWQKKEIFYSEKKHSLEQHLQGCGRIPITGGFQDVIGQSAG